MKRKLLSLFAVFLFIFSCHEEDGGPAASVNYRKEMRDFVIGISQYAKSTQPGFVVIPQNGIELVTDNGEPDGNQSTAYMAAIDGNGQEDLFYGYDEDNKPTSAEDTNYLKELLNVSKNAGKTILVTDYCETPSYMDQSFSFNYSAGYISFAADHRELDHIPIYPEPVFHANPDDIAELSAAKNFLYLINNENFSSKSAFIEALAATDYDLIIMDLFFKDGTAFSQSEISQLKHKANGGIRIVICYMSIGEAEDYRYYWQATWHNNRPEWLDAENPDWSGNFKVRYWNKSWQNIMYGNSGSYLSKILDAGFDGVYLDIIDAFEYFE